MFIFPNKREAWQVTIAVLLNPSYRTLVQFQRTHICFVLLTWGGVKMSEGGCAYIKIQNLGYICLQWWWKLLLRQEITDCKCNLLLLSSLLSVERLLNGFLCVVNSGFWNVCCIFPAWCFGLTGMSSDPASWGPPWQETTWRSSWALTSSHPTVLPSTTKQRSCTSLTEAWGRSRGAIMMAPTDMWV